MVKTSRKNRGKLMRNSLLIAELLYSRRYVCAMDIQKAIGCGKRQAGRWMAELIEIMPVTIDKDGRRRYVSRIRR